MRKAPEVVREVGVDDVRVTPEQPLLHLYNCLLGVSPCAVGVDFRRNIGFEDRLQHQQRAVMQTRSRTQSKGFSRIDIDTNESDPSYSVSGQLMGLPLKSLRGWSPPAHGQTCWP